MDNDKILAGVRQLDTSNDNHWTADGLPRLDTVKMLTGEQSLDRNAVEAAAPGFKRTNAADYKTDAETAAAGTPPPVEPVVTPTPTADTTTQTIVPPVDGDEVAPAAPVVPPVPSAVLPTAPAADGLPTANEPTATQGAQPQGQNVDQVTPPELVEAGKPVQIMQGVTEKGVNMLNSEEDDARDAAASTAADPNKPGIIGGTVDDPASLRDGAVLSSSEGEAQLPTLDNGSVGDPDAIEALEAELERASEDTAHWREGVDVCTQRLSAAQAEESRLRTELQKVRPRTGTMEAIQGYFAQQDKVAGDRVAARQAVVDSGIDLKALGKAIKGAPIDEARKPKS